MKDRKENIIPVLEDEQTFLGGKDIHVVRNKLTGWPLFELGVFTSVENGNKTVYIPAIGGGDCQSIPYGLYGFARLIQQNEKFKFIKTVAEPFNFVRLNEKTIDVEVKKPPILIRWVQETRREDASVIFNGNQKELRDTLFGLNKIVAPGIPFMSSWGADREIPKENLEKSIVGDYAIFFEGKIYVDLEKVLDLANVNKDSKENFKGYFEVDEYLEKQNKHGLQTKFEKEQSEKLPVDGIKSNLLILEKELAKESKNFSNAQNQPLSTKSLKYQALEKLYNYVHENKDSAYINKPVFVDLYQKAIKFSSQRFIEQAGFFVRKTENLERLIKNIPPSLKSEILTKELISSLPDKYKKLVEPPVSLKRF